MTLDPNSKNVEGISMGYKLMLRTRVSQLLGIEFPIFSAPMGPDLAGPDLAAAVSSAGGLGLMQAQLSPPADFREQIQRVREATDKPFGRGAVHARGARLRFFAHVFRSLGDDFSEQQPKWTFLHPSYTHRLFGGNFDRPIR